MQIRRALVTAAAPQQRTLPLQTIVDTDGVPKTALRIILEEALSAGVEEIAIIIAPGDRDAYRLAAGDLAGRLTFIEQDAPRGYGYAVHLGRAFTAGEPFLHLVSDHLSLSRIERRCAQQLVDIAKVEECSVSAVQATREHLLPLFGTIGGRRDPKLAGLYQVENVIEKPTPTQAEQSLLVPGLRAGYYLCLFGMHVLTPAVMDILGKLIAEAGSSGRVQLSDALNILSGRERYLAYEVTGRRYDMGGKYGVLVAQLALAMAGKDREEVLESLVELLATRQQDGK